MRMRRQKRGWIRIVEAFISIMLIAGALLIVINQGYIGREDISETVYQAERAILKEIQLDDSLRDQILEVNLSDDPVEIPSEVINRINNRKPAYLFCEAKICRLDEICYQSSSVSTDVYSQAVAITANLEKYDPRQLKVFCWVESEV
jgi:hypothetical protein